MGDAMQSFRIFSIVSALLFLFACGGGSTFEEQDTSFGGNSSGSTTGSGDGGDTTTGTDTGTILFVNNILNAEKVKLKINLDSGGEAEITRGGFFSYSLSDFVGTFTVNLTISAFLPVKEGATEKTVTVLSGRSFDVTAGTVKAVVMTGTINDADSESIKFEESSTAVKTVPTGSFLYRIQRADDETDPKDFHVHQVGETITAGTDGTYVATLGNGEVSAEFTDENTRDILVTVTEPGSLDPIATFALADSQLDGQVFLSTFPGKVIAGNPFMLTQATTKVNNTTSAFGFLPPLNTQRDTNSRVINLLASSAPGGTSVKYSSFAAETVLFEENTAEKTFKLRPLEDVTFGIASTKVSISELVGVTNNIHNVVLSNVNPEVRVIPDIKQGIYETSKVTVISRLDGKVGDIDLASVDVYFANTDILPLAETKDVTVDASTKREEITSTNLKPGEYFIFIAKTENNVRHHFNSPKVPHSLAKEKNYQVYLYQGAGGPSDVRIKVLLVN